MRAVLATMILAFALVTPAWIGPFKDGPAAARAGDYTTALRLWRSLADQGNARAQSTLGVMYGTGQGVPQDYAPAGKWCRLAAGHGSALAHHSEQQSVLDRNQARASLAETLGYAGYEALDRATAATSPKREA